MLFLQEEEDGYEISHEAYTMDGIAESIIKVKGNNCYDTTIEILEKVFGIENARNKVDSLEVVEDQPVSADDTQCGDITAAAWEYVEKNNQEVSGGRKK